MKRNVVVGVTGGIAAYKTCELVSRLVKAGYGVKVVMTEHAKEFVSPLTFETLSNNAVIGDMFAPKPHFDVEHVSLAKWAGVYVIAHHVLYGDGSGPYRLPRHEYRHV